MDSGVREGVAPEMPGVGVAGRKIVSPQAVPIMRSSIRRADSFGSGQPKRVALGSAVPGSVLDLLGPDLLGPDL